MATETEQLVVQLEARIRDFEKNMAKAEKTASGAFNAMRRQSVSAAKQMEADMVRSSTRINQALASTSGTVGAVGRAFGGMGVRLAASLAAFLSVRAVIDSTRQALDKFGDIADKSGQAGLDPERFQELAYQASLAGVSMEDLSGALNTFAKNSGLAVAGKGKMVSALQALDKGLLENIRNAKTQDERLRLMVDAMDRTTNSSQRAALASAAFGDAGAKLANALQGGTAQMDATAAKAQDLGIIIDRDLIARSDELGDQLDTATQIMNTQFSAALVSLSPILIKAAELAADVASAIGQIIDSMQSLENMTSRGLEDELRASGIKRLEIEQQILEKRQEQRELSSVAVSNGFGDRINGEIAALEQQNAALSEQEKKILGIIDARKQAQEATKPGTGDGDNGGTLPVLPTPGSTRSTATGASDIERQQQAVTDLIARLKLEQAQVGMTAAEIAKSNALREAGATATEGQRIEIERTIDATYAEKEALAALAEQQQLMKDLISGAMTDIRSALEDGKITTKEWGDVFVNVLNKIGDKIQEQLIDQLLGIGTNNGTGLLGGLLGGLFGGGGIAGGGIPAFANGTNNAPGGLALVGERGPELVTLPRGSKVTPNHKLAQAAGGGSMRVDIGVSVDDEGAIRAYVKRQVVETGGPMVRAGIEAFSKAELPKRFNEVANNRRKVGK